MLVLKFPKHFILQIICSNIPPLKVGFGTLCSHLIALDDVNYLMSQQYDGSLLGIINLEAPQLLRKGFKTSKHGRPEESGTTPKYVQLLKNNPWFILSLIVFIENIFKMQVPHDLFQLQHMESQNFHVPQAMGKL